jgi:hypothetical protein
MVIIVFIYSHDEPPNTQAWLPYILTLDHAVIQARNLASADSNGMSNLEEYSSDDPTSSFLQALATPMLCSRLETRRKKQRLLRRYALNLRMLHLRGKHVCCVCALISCLYLQSLNPEWNESFTVYVHASSSGTHLLQPHRQLPRQSWVC